jgi:hypothetical protein
VGAGREPAGRGQGMWLVDQRTLAQPILARFQRARVLNSALAVANLTEVALYGDFVAVPDHHFVNALDLVHLNLPGARGPGSGSTLPASLPPDARRRGKVPSNNYRDIMESMTL